MPIPRRLSLIGLLGLFACEGRTPTGDTPVAALAVEVVEPATAPLAAPAPADSIVVLVSGTSSRRLRGLPGETVTIPGLPVGPYTVRLEGYAGPMLVWDGETTLNLAAGATATATITRNVLEHLPEVTISRPGQDTTVVAGTATDLVGTADDVEDGDLSATIAWSSDLDGALGTGGTLAPTLSDGVHTVVAAVQDAAGQPASDTVIVTVEPAVLQPGEVCADFTPSAIAAFADGALWAAVRSALGLGPAEDVTCGALEGLTDLQAPSLSISDLVGAQNLTGLATLDLSDNSITAIGSLSGLTGLTTLDLSGNAGLSDIQPLIDNTGLGAGDTVDLRSTAVTCTDVGALAASGAAVAADCSSPVVVIVEPSQDTTVVAGDPVSFTATVTDAEDGDLGASVTWTSDLDGALGSGASVSPSLSLGVHTVVATVADSDGLVGADSLVVTAVAPVLGPAELCSDNLPESIATFAEANLEAGVRSELSLGPGDDLTCALVSTVTDLQLASVALSSLVGMQNLTSLEVFVAASAGITDMAPLSTLTSLTSLDLQDNAISDLGPLTGLTALTSLDLSTNSITDVSALLGLTGLTDLSLADNAALSDIQPLIDNTGLGAGDSVTLTGTSVSCADVMALEAEGVAVTSDCTPPTVSITEPTQDTTTVGGDPVTLTGTASDAEDGDLTGVIDWSSDLDGALGTGGTVSPVLSLGTHTISAAVQDSDLFTAADTVTVTVFPALSVTTTSLPDGQEDVAYDQTVAATGGDGSYTWGLAAGSMPLPTGLSIASNGQILGTPTVPGMFDFTVEVTSGDGQTAQQALSITIHATLVITTTALPDGTQSVVYGEFLTATGGDGSYTWSIVVGTLPSGLSLTPGTGEIAGTPTFVEAQQFTVQVDSGDGQMAQLALSLTITAAGGLVAHYELDAIGAGTVTDVSGFGNTGTVVGEPTVVPGASSNALVFDGVEDFIEAPDRPQIEGLTEATLMAWIRTTGRSTMSVIQKGLAADFNYRLAVDGGVVSVVAYQADGSDHLLATGATAIDDGQWHHVAAVLSDGAFARVYVDGTEDGSDLTPSGTWNTAGAGALHIATHNVGVSNEIDHFVGRADEVRIYNRVLTPGEINTIANLVTPPVSDGPIVFQTNRDLNDEIYAMGADGSSPQRFTTSLFADQHPVFSPDGTQIAFGSNRTGSFQIFLMDEDGSSQTQLTTVGGTEASWSPDGSQILTAPGQQIWVIETDGSSETQLTTGPENNFDPAFSPDGTQIVFTSDADTDLEIFVMDADGSNLVQLTTNGDDDSEPEWSPDGTRIVFYREPSGGPSTSGEIVIMDADGSNQVVLTSNSVADTHPKFSADGTRIVFETARDGNVEVYAMDLDGGNPVRLTNNAFTDGQPSWSR